jgi:hypothetical protein
MLAIKGETLYMRRIVEVYHTNCGPHDLAYVWYEGAFEECAHPWVHYPRGAQGQDDPYTVAPEYVAADGHMERLTSTGEFKLVEIAYY